MFVAGWRKATRRDDVEVLCSAEAAAALPLLRYMSCDMRRGLQREDGDKVGHFTAAIVFELEPLFTTGTHLY